MKLIDVANKVDKSKQNEDWVDTTDIGEELGIDVPYTDQDRLKCYWVGSWLCTDTYVGYRMYFLDDEPIAFSVQNARKSDEKFHWFSEEIATKAKDYLLTLVVEEEYELNVTVCDINQDIGDTYKIEFNSQIIDPDRAELNSEKVEILERVKNEPYGIDTELKIKLLNGEEKSVSIRDLDFGYYVI